jgi:hypothetical protein
MSTRRAVLLIADIGGYTDYMRFHRSVLGHAEAATACMLNKVVAAARGFDLIEIEGDAAFLSRDTDRMNGDTFDALLRTVVTLHAAFHAERRRVQLNMCPCGSCKKTDDLKLKFVAHVGEVATQTIRHRKKLVGVDVIYVHRLLKNSVEVPEYLLVSDELLREGGAARPDLEMREVLLDLEGIGNVLSHYADLDGMAAPVPDPTWPQRIGGTFAMAGRGLPHALRRRRPAASAA